jgi:hypothetical protein
MPKKADALDIFKPEYLNLYELVGFVKAHLTDLINKTFSEQGLKQGKAWAEEFYQRLAEIKKDLLLGAINMRMSWALGIALQKAAIESGFIVEQEWQTWSQSGLAIDKIRRSLGSFLKNPTQITEHTRRIKLFCEILCQEMPFAEHFRPGPVAPEIKIPRCTRTNWMADGQPGEAD